QTCTRCAVRGLSARHASGSNKPRSRLAPRRGSRRDAVGLQTSGNSHAKESADTVALLPCAPAYVRKGPKSRLWSRGTRHRGGIYGSGVPIAIKGCFFTLASNSPTIFSTGPEIQLSVITFSVSS